MKKASIALSMIVRNEETHLDNCLNCVKDYVDEIVIVDTGSQDKTCDIARKYTDKVYNIEWENDFSKARNFGLEKVQSDWVLVLDADELIDYENYLKMLRYIESNNADIYMVYQRNKFSDISLSGISVDKIIDSFSTLKVGEYYDCRQVRLFKKHKRFSGKIFEGMSDSEKDLHQTDIVLYHNSIHPIEKAYKYYDIGLASLKNGDLTLSAWKSLLILYYDGIHLTVG
jgi:glycosyltransferase involved in cell wall biosynthesis